MQLIEQFWALLTSVLNIITLSPFNDGFVEQNPSRIPLSESPGLSFRPHKNLSEGPVFRPPGTPVFSSFQCDYRNMPGWEFCSTPKDRSCWLRRISDGKQFNISTDYENEMPNGTTRFYKLDIRDDTYDKDGLDFPYAKLYNGEYPGPWIEACWGDRIIVNVTNNLAFNGTSVHWHGLRQFKTMHMDGVNGITQCPIAPQGNFFVYNFTVGQYGSSWYHSHYSVQYADGATGPITLHGPASAPYDEAISPPLIMTDWGHNSAFNASSNDAGLYLPDILLNGRGNITKYYNTTKPTAPILPAYSITFREPQPGLPNMKYLLRIINTSFQTTFLFTIDNHLLSVVEADFVPITPYTTDSILIGIGQRYEVIVEAKPQQDPLNPIPLPRDGNYWIRTYVVMDCFDDQKPGDPGYEETGILRYNPFSTTDPTTTNWTDISLACVDETTANLKPIVPWIVKDPSNNPPSGENFTLATFKSGYPLAFWSLGAADSPALRIDYSNITFLNLDNTGGWNDVWRVQPEDYNASDWIYIIIQAPAHTGSHPIHLHGHDFAILEKVANKTYDPKTANLRLNNPPRRDVVLLPASGYIVIAFKADNPGTWLVHCHIAFHISSGLGMQILEDREAAAMIWPTGNSEALRNAQTVCNAWDVWHNNSKNYYPQPNCNDTADLCFQNDSGV